MTGNDVILTSIKKIFLHQVIYNIIFTGKIKNLIDQLKKKIAENVQAISARIFHVNVLSG